MSHWRRKPCPICGRPMAVRASRCGSCDATRKRLFALEVTATPGGLHAFGLSVTVLISKGYRRARKLPDELAGGEWTESRDGSRVKLWWRESTNQTEAA